MAERVHVAIGNGRSGTRAGIAAVALRFADAALPLVFALKIQSEQVAGIFQIAEGVHGVVGNHDAGKTGTNAGGLVEQFGTAFWPFGCQTFFEIHAVAIRPTPLGPVGGKYAERQAQH